MCGHSTKTKFHENVAPIRQCSNHNTRVIPGCHLDWNGGVRFLGGKPIHAIVVHAIAGFCSKDKEWWLGHNVGRWGRKAWCRRFFKYNMTQRHLLFLQPDNLQWLHGVSLASALFLYSTLDKIIRLFSTTISELSPVADVSRLLLSEVSDSSMSPLVLLESLLSS